MTDERIELFENRVAAKELILIRLDSCIAEIRTQLRELRSCKSSVIHQLRCYLGAELTRKLQQRKDILRELEEYEEENADIAAMAQTLREVRAEEKPAEQVEEEEPQKDEPLHHVRIEGHAYEIAPGESATLQFVHKEGRTEEVRKAQPYDWQMDPTGTVLSLVEAEDMMREFIMHELCTDERHVAKYIEDQDYALTWMENISHTHAWIWAEQNAIDAAVNSIRDTKRMAEWALRRIRHAAV